MSEIAIVEAFCDLPDIRCVKGRRPTQGFIHPRTD
jgi:hypothetical protein